MTDPQRAAGIAMSAQGVGARLIRKEDDRPCAAAGSSLRTFGCPE